MSNPIITLGEILNPEKYTGIVERDFHLYNKNRKDEPDYVHIEPDVKPKCTCIMYKNKYDKKNLDRCEHISYVIKDVLGLKEKENLRYTEEELKKAFEETESKNKKIIRETYGLVKRKNFKFPNPKVYKYEYDEERSSFLKEQGIYVLRLQNEQVWANVDGVKEEILKFGRMIQKNVDLASVQNHMLKPSI